MRRSAALLAALAAALVVFVPPGSAQDHENPLVPGGSIRLWAEPTLERWDSRFGRRTEDGMLVDEEEPLGFDLTGERLGTDRIPSLAPLEQAIGEAMGDPAFRLDLGASRLLLSRERTVVPFRLDVGVTDWLTVGAMVPLVRTQAEAEFALLGGGNVGLSPAGEEPERVEDFLRDLTAAAAAVSARAAEICQDRGADHPDCVEARALESEISSLASLLETTYGSAPLFPIARSVAGQALLGRMAALEARAAALGVGGVPSSLPLAGGPLTTAELEALIEDPALGVNGDPLRTVRRLWTLGDVELSAAIRLLEGGALPGSAASADGFSYRVGGGLLVRLGTGQAEVASNFVDIGTGDAQTDVEGRIFATLGWGSRFALWTDGRYGVQSSRTIRRRIAPPEVVLAPAESLADVEWTPGDYLSLEVAPRLHVTEGVALSLRYSFWHKAEDTFEADPSDAPPAEPSLLELETEQTRHMLGVGASYSTLAAVREGRYRLPLEARVRFLTSVAGSGGRTPRLSAVEAGLRVYWKIWGD